MAVERRQKRRDNDGRLLSSNRRSHTLKPISGRSLYRRCGLPGCGFLAFSAWCFKHSALSCGSLFQNVNDPNTCLVARRLLKICLHWPIIVLLSCPDQPRYYDGDYSRMPKILTGCKETRCIFLMGGRNVDGFDVPEELKDIFISIPAEQFHMDISSAEIRKQGGM
ncbi:hypothetical protein L6164_001676 [Bauhinia variegata]|uniref:Uncharacterized protein n=1 Tax=Bauhinia variegata TaxID=167791 RepID=A0ACB9Q9R2_BAUVA|nr:hypothetical protein L6164_001676 [Bauhinia variegata]